jgi:hypothetical protein
LVFRHVQGLGFLVAGKVFVIAHFVSGLAHGKIDFSCFSQAAESLGVCKFFMRFANQVLSNFRFLFFCLALFFSGFLDCFVVTTGVVSFSFVELVFIKTNRWSLKQRIASQRSPPGFTFKNTLPASDIIVLLHKLPQYILLLLRTQPQLWISLSSSLHQCFRLGGDSLLHGMLVALPET